MAKYQLPPLKHEAFGVVDPDHLAELAKRVKAGMVSLGFYDVKMRVRSSFEETAVTSVDCIVLSAEGNFKLVRFYRSKGADILWDFGPME